MGNWRPAIGDPDFMGWLITGSYLFGALVAWLVLLPLDREKKEIVRFWKLIAVLMTFLGINKQLDLHNLMTEMGRQAARAGDWLDQRRAVQFWFVVVMGSAAIALFIWLTLRYRALFKRFPLAFGGVFFLLSFIVIRGASFHHFDQILLVNYFGMRVNQLLELAGIYLVVIAGVYEMIRSILHHGE
jgi:hypothetical protein